MGLESLIPAALQTVGGLAQAFTSGVKKKERALERFSENSPQYNPNKSILDYYSTALNKYNISPYGSTLYKKTVQDAQRTTAQGLESLRGRGGAVAGVSNLIAGENDNLLKAATTAENMKAREFDVLGNATGMKAREEGKAFQINKQDPFERKYNLLAQKAAAAAKQKNDGLQNIFGGISNAATLGLGGGGNKSTPMLPPVSADGTYDSNVPMTGGLRNRRSPNFN